jgi:hypothetical protein
MPGASDFPKIAGGAATQPWSDLKRQSVSTTSWTRATGGYLAAHPKWPGSEASAGKRATCGVGRALASRAEVGGAVRADDAVESARDASDRANFPTHSGAATGRGYRRRLPPPDCGGLGARFRVGGRSSAPFRSQSSPSSSTGTPHKSCSSESATVISIKSPGSSSQAPGTMTWPSISGASP